MASADVGSLTTDFEELQSALEKARLKRHDLQDQIREAKQEGRRRRETAEGQRLAQMQAELERTHEETTQLQVPRESRYIHATVPPTVPLIVACTPWHALRGMHSVACTP